MIKKKIKEKDDDDVYCLLLLFFFYPTVNLLLAQNNCFVKSKTCQQKLGWLLSVTGLKLFRLKIF